jgi:hypothetical protein
MGHPCRLPLGLLGIVLIPEDSEFSGLEGVKSKLFFKQKLCPWFINQNISEWGYNYIPSGKMRREIQGSLSIPKCAQKIERANETGIFRWDHFKSNRRVGERS